MVRKEPERSYAIPFVGTGRSITLGIRQRAAVNAIIGRAPSPEFMSAYCSMLGDYVEHGKMITSSTAPAVKKRLKAVSDGVINVQKSLKQLNSTDLMLYGRSARIRMRRGDKYAVLNELSDVIMGILPTITEAVAMLDTEPKQGRMPGWAEQGLAKGLAQILFAETQVVPTVKSKGTFDRLLQLALSQAKPAKPRKDVTALMRHSLKVPPAETLLLKYFRNNHEK